MTDLIPLKAGRKIWGHCDLYNIFLNEEGKFVENFVLLMSEWKKLAIGQGKRIFCGNHVYTWDTEHNFSF